METLQSEQRTTEKPKHFSGSTEKLLYELFGTLRLMYGEECCCLPSVDEMESHFSTLSVFNVIEFEQLLLFLDRFLKRMAYLIAETARHYLHYALSEKTIDYFFDITGDEITGLFESYHATNPFERLLQLYIVRTDKGGII